MLGSGKGGNPKCLPFHSFITRIRNRNNGMRNKEY